MSIWRVKRESCPTPMHDMSLVFMQFAVFDLKKKNWGVLSKENRYLHQIYESTIVLTQPSLATKKPGGFAVV